MSTGTTTGVDEPAAAAAVVVVGAFFAGPVVVVVATSAYTRPFPEVFAVFAGLGGDVDLLVVVADAVGADDCPVVLVDVVVGAGAAVGFAVVTPSLENILGMIVILELSL